MSNYPPGVTGNELAISGPDREWDEPDFTCRICGNEGGSGWYHRQEGSWIDCPACGHSEQQDEDPDRADREYEARGDR